MWRPILCCFLAELFECKKENWIDILRFAATTEIIHNGTLMVDDVEDDSEVRRNKECVHKIFGVDVALNTGNFMYFCNFGNVLSCLKIDKSKRYDL